MTARVKRAIALTDGKLEPVALTKHIGISPNGLTITGKPAPAEWTHVGELLPASEAGVQFAMGDFQIKGEEFLGEEFWQHVDAETGWSAETVRNYRWIAEKIKPHVRRMDKLKLKHHQLVAALDEKQQAYWLNRAADSEDEPWTVARLRDEMAGTDDAPEPRYYVMYEVRSEQEQEDHVTRLQGEGFEVRKITSRRRKAEEK